MIYVSVDGSYQGYLTAYYNSAPTCGTTYGGALVTVTVAAGSHYVSAYSDTGLTWSGSYSTYSSGCTLYELY